VGFEISPIVAFQQAQSFISTYQRAVGFKAYFYCILFEMENTS